MNWNQWSINSQRMEQLLLRCELLQPLLTRSVEEEVMACVDFNKDTIKELRENFLKDQNLTENEKLKSWLQEREWNNDDLNMHICRPKALDKFAHYRFGAGVEETFLERKRDLDTVVYSLLRVQDEGLARELWIQISEGEISFPEAASRHSDGPESKTKGVLGPFPIGTLQPEIAERLRHLSQGQLTQPEHLGPWWILFRLEQISPAKLDEEMRNRLLREKFQEWVQDRCRRIRHGDSLEELDYDGSS